MNTKKQKAKKSKVITADDYIKFVDTFGDAQTSFFRTRNMQASLIANPEQTLAFRPGCVEWVDFFNKFINHTKKIRDYFVEKDIRM